MKIQVAMYPFLIVCLLANSLAEYLIEDANYKSTKCYNLDLLATNQQEAKDIKVVIWLETDGAKQPILRVAFVSNSGRLPRLRN